MHHIQLKLIFHCVVVALCVCCLDVLDVCVFLCLYGWDGKLNVACATQRLPESSCQPVSSGEQPGA